MFSSNHVDKQTRFILTVYVVSILYIVFDAFTYDLSSFIDEILCVFLFFYALFRCDIAQKKEIQIFAVIVILYLIYSLFLGINVHIAAVRDFFQFMKPFFCFFATYYATINISRKQKHKLKILSYILAIYCYSIFPYINDLYPNTTNYYHACTFAGILYLFSSEMKTKNYWIFLVFLLPGLASFRSKFLAELIVYAFLLLYVKKPIKPSLRLIFIMLILAAVAIWVNYEKFSMYFITGYDEGAARTLMYYTSLEMLKDYFPFGSGFGTFGTDASGLYYSPIYYKYGLNYVFGCSPNDYGTETSFFMDTFYPVILGQFGIIGTILFIKFWLIKLKEISAIMIEKYKLFMIVFVYLAIEGIASGTFLGAQTVPAMMTLGLCLNLKNRKLCQR